MKLKGSYSGIVVVLVLFCAGNLIAYAAENETNRSRMAPMAGTEPGWDLAGNEPSQTLG